MSESVAGLILAGGKGSRLGGVNKALLDVGGRTNIARVVGVLEQLCGELVVIANDEALATIPNVRLILDREPHAGVLPALAQGLENLDSDLAIAVACDMPFLNARLLTEQVQRASAADVVIPSIDGRPEPMHTVYRRTACLEAIRSALAAGERRMISFLDRVQVVHLQEAEVRQIDPDLRSFFNTNTPDDLERARALAAES